MCANFIGTAYLSLMNYMVCIFVIVDIGFRSFAYRKHYQ